MKSVCADVAELVYATDLKSVARKGLRVQVPPSAPFQTFLLCKTFDSAGRKSVWNESFSWLKPIRALVCSMQRHTVSYICSVFWTSVALLDNYGFMLYQAIHSRFVETADDFSPELKAAIERAGPIELTSRADLPFSDYLCRAITGQQLSVKAAKTIWGRVEASANDKPLSEHFCETNTDLLRSCGLSGAKTKTVCAIADLARRGELKDDHLREMSAVDRTVHITAVWGVGQWTADMMNMFYFGEPDIWPEGDVAARKTLERLTSPRRKTIRTAERFAPHRSYLALYMWAHADAPPV